MKLRTGEPWRPAPEYASTLRGVGVNLLVRDVSTSVRFRREVLQLDPMYADPDFAALQHDGTDFMLHADHTYDTHPLLDRSQGVRGAGVELRVYAIDPDAAERRARDTGHKILAPTTDRGHGLRECYVVDPDGYVWVPCRVMHRGSE